MIHLAQQAAEVAATPGWMETAVPIILAVLGLLAAYLERRGNKRASGALRAVVQGVEELRASPNDSKPATARIEMEAERAGPAVTERLNAEIAKARLKRTTQG